MTPRRQPDAARIQQLRDRLMLQLRFFEGVEEFPSGPQTRALVEDAARRGDERSLRLISKEVDAMATLALTPDQREGLEAILQQRLGVDKEAERADLKKAMHSIIARGTINSEKERRRVQDYIEMMEALGERDDDLPALRRLL